MAQRNGHLNDSSVPLGGGLPSLLASPSLPLPPSTFLTTPSCLIVCRRCSRPSLRPPALLAILSSPGEFICFLSFKCHQQLSRPKYMSPDLFFELQAHAASCVVQSLPGCLVHMSNLACPTFYSLSLLTLQPPPHLSWHRWRSCPSQFPLPLSQFINKSYWFHFQNPCYASLPHCVHCLSGVQETIFCLDYCISILTQCIIPPGVSSQPHPHSLSSTKKPEKWLRKQI